MSRSTPVLPVHHQLLESTQTHVHCVSDANELSHPLSSPSPLALNLSQDEALISLGYGLDLWIFKISVQDSVSSVCIT